MKHIRYHQIFESDRSEYIKSELISRKDEIDFMWDILSSYEDEGVQISFGLINPQKWMGGVLVYKDSAPYVFHINDYFSKLNLDQMLIGDFKIGVEFEYFLCINSNSSDFNRSMSNCLIEMVERIQESYEVEFFDKCYYRFLEMESSIVKSRELKIDFNNWNGVLSCPMISEVGLNFDILR